MELRPSTLNDLDARVTVPRYDRAALRRTIVHIGVGGFHRAHLATYVDELCRAGHSNWAIVGAGTLPGDAAMAEALGAQDGLYTLVVRGRDRTDVRVIGSIVDYVHAHPDPAPLAKQITDPETQIVSLTVTEGGYPVDDDTGAFDAASPHAASRSAFATLVEGLRLRRETGAGPLTVLSCDNVIGNGDHTRTATVGVARTVDAALAQWIESDVAFPNSMVDRITPATTQADRTWLADTYGVNDAWPVVTEPFRQWVVEDRFAGRRPPLEELDVIVTDDVEPYELFKLRLLNAGHSVLAYLARVAGHEAVDEVIAEQRFADLLRRFFDDEAGPVVPDTPGIDLTRYKDSLLTRFANPAIRDQVDRLCMDGSSKLPKFLLPTVRAQLDAGGPIDVAMLAVAGWCEYLLGRDADGNGIPVANDPHLDEARDHARRSLEDPQAFLAFARVFGHDLPAQPRVRAAFATSLGTMRERGVRAAIDAALSRRDGDDDG